MLCFSENRLNNLAFDPLFDLSLLYYFSNLTDHACIDFKCPVYDFWLVGKTHIVRTIKQETSLMTFLLKKSFEFKTAKTAITLKFEYVPCIIAFYGNELV